MTGLGVYSLKDFCFLSSSGRNSMFTAIFTCDSFLSFFFKVLHTVNQFVEEFSVKL